MIPARASGSQREPREPSASLGEPSASLGDPSASLGDPSASLALLTQTWPAISRRAIDGRELRDGCRRGRAAHGVLRGDSGPVSGTSASANPSRCTPTASWATASARAPSPSPPAPVAIPRRYAAFTTRCCTLSGRRPGTTTPCDARPLTMRSASTRPRGSGASTRRSGVEAIRWASRRSASRSGGAPSDGSRGGGTGGKLSSHFCFRRVKVACDDGLDPGSHEPVWLMMEWPEGEDKPKKFTLTTLPKRMSHKQIARLTKERWRTERVYEELKGELGLDHFEGRSFAGWHHHVSVALCCFAFVVAERVQHFPPRPDRKLRPTRSSSRPERTSPTRSSPPGSPSRACWRAGCPLPLLPSAQRQPSQWESRDF